MKDNPFLVSLLIGLVVVLVIAGVSLLVKMNSMSETYKQELSKNMDFERTIENLKAENQSFKENVGELIVEVGKIKEEYAKLDALKKKLEENLKEELMKQKLSR